MTQQQTAVSAISSADTGRADEPRIRVRDLGKFYGTLEVFRGIDFDVGERET